MTTIGGNPPTAGNLNLSDEVVEEVFWKSSSNATIQEVDEIKLDGTTIWEKPNYDIIVSAQITADSRSSGHVILNVNAPEKIAYWKYAIRQGSSTAPVGPNSGQYSSSQIEIPYSEFTNGNNYIRVQGFKNNEVRGETQTGSVLVIKHSVSIVYTGTSSSRPLTIDPAISILPVDVNNDTVWEYQIDSNAWVTGGSIKNGYKDGIYYKLTEPLSVPAGDHTLRVRYKGVRDGQSYIHDTDTKEFSLAAPSTLTLNGDASLTKTFEEIQVSGDSLVFSGNVPMGSTSDMDEEATRESHPQYTFIGGGNVETVWRNSYQADTGKRQSRQWDIRPESTTQAGITWSGDVKRLWMSQGCNWVNHITDENCGGNRFIESPAGYLYAAGQNIFGELGTNTGFVDVTSENTWESRIGSRPQNFVGLLAKYYKSHDLGVYPYSGYETDKFKIVYQQDLQGNVSPITNIKKVYVSQVSSVISRTTYILKNDGTVWASGANYFGELGSHQTDPRTEAGRFCQGYGWLDYPGSMGGYENDYGDSRAYYRRLRIRNIFCQVMTTDADDIPNFINNNNNYPAGKQWKFGPFVYESTTGGSYWQPGYNGPGNGEYSLTTEDYDVTGQSHKMHYKFIRHHLSPLTGVKDIVNHRNGAWFLKTDGTMYSIGSGYTSMLGTGHMMKAGGNYSRYAYNPRMDSKPGVDDEWVDLADGGQIVTSSTSYEFRYIQGSAYARQMYHGTTSGRETWTKGDAITNVKQIHGVANHVELQDQAPSDTHTKRCTGSIGVFVKNDGTVWGMGRDHARALGEGFPNTYWSSIIRATTFSWGSTGGVGSDCASDIYNCSVYPVQLKATSTTFLTGVNEAYVSATGENTFFMMNDGKLKVLGDNTFGQAGTNSGITEIDDAQKNITGTKRVVENDDYCGVRYGRLDFCHGASGQPQYFKYRYAQNVPHVILYPRNVKKFSKTNALSVDYGPLFRNVLTGANADVYSGTTGSNPAPIGLTTQTIPTRIRFASDSGGLTSTNSYQTGYVTDSAATDITDVIALKFLDRRSGCQILTADGRAYSLDVMDDNLQPGKDLPQNMVTAGLVHTGQVEYETFATASQQSSEPFNESFYTGRSLGIYGFITYSQYVYKRMYYGCAIEVDLSYAMKEGYEDPGAVATYLGQNYDSLISKIIKKNGVVVQTIPSGSHTNPWYASSINNPGIYTIEFDFTKEGQSAATVTRTVTINS